MLNRMVHISFTASVYIKTEDLEVLVVIFQLLGCLDDRIRSDIAQRQLACTISSESESGSPTDSFK